MKAKVNKFILILIPFLFGFNCIAQDNSIIKKELDSFFNAQLDTFDLVAISAGLIKDNNIVWSEAFGYKDLDSKEFVSPNTLFHQGSISKTITLATFLSLMEEKNINIDDDINNYLPFEVRNPNHVTSPITFKMLLTHTSSISDVNISKMKNKMSMLNSDNDSPEKLGVTIKNILNKDGELYDTSFYLEGEPGTQYAYSNLGYSLIGYLIEIISGQSFIDYCQENIFDPLEMKKSTFLLSKTDTLDFAYQYYYNDGNLTKVTPYTWPGYMDGSLRTNVNEYSNFLIMLIHKGVFKGKKILAEETVDMMLTCLDLPGEQSARLFEPLGRAILWNKVRVNIGDKDFDMYHFNGFGAGFFTEVFFSPDENIGGMFYITGQFKSFPQMGRAIKENMEELLKTIESK